MTWTTFAPPAPPASRRRTRYIARRRCRHAGAAALLTTAEAEAVREYRHHATDVTIEALRRLRRPWAGYRLTDDVLHVALADGGGVTIRAEEAELEPALTAHRLTAAVDAPPAGELAAPAAFSAGGNDVVVFRSESWIEGGGEADDGRVVQFTGSPLQRSASAVAVCAVDDAVVVASAAGTGLLVRCALRPRALEVTDDAPAIAAFLVERRYQAAGRDEM